LFFEAAFDTLGEIVIDPHIDKIVKIETDGMVQLLGEKLFCPF